MSRKLEILALEPYYGGVRKDTLDLLAKHSKHHWNIFKLPARRLERRLSSAAQWFSEQISRTLKNPCDIVFASDAMNLADLFRILPQLARVPSVAYFYRNQLDPHVEAEDGVKIATLSTAQSATEIWFNSLYHLKAFLTDSANMAEAHPELGGRGSVHQLIAKAQLLPPPVELTPPRDSDVVDAERKGRAVCIDNRDPRPELYSAFLQEVNRRKEPIALLIIGQALPQIPAGIPAAIVDPKRDDEVIKALRKAEIFITAHDPATFDALALRAMAMGCIPVMPALGYFEELIPKALQKWCLFDFSPEDLASKVMDLWYLRRPSVSRKELDRIFKRYIPTASIKVIDKRLAHLVSLNSN